LAKYLIKSSLLLIPVLTIAETLTAISNSLKMGADLKLYIGHNLTHSEIISFPEFIDNCQELKDVYISEIQSKLEYRITRENAIKRLTKKSTWGKTTISELLDSWKNNRNSKLVEENGYIYHDIDCYFGSISINEKTLEIDFSPEHKYANLYHPANRRFIILFSRAFAKVMNKKHIVYCNDMGQTSFIEDDATEGKSINEIIEHAIQKLGTPSKSLKVALEKGFIIDNRNSAVIDFDN